MITSYNGDMLTEIDNVKDNSINLLLTDPPYNISDKAAHPDWTSTDENGNKVNMNKIHDQRFDKSFDNDWDTFTHDDFIDNINKWAIAWFPKLKKGSAFAIFISDRYISHLQDALINAGFEPKRVFSWKKPAAVPFNRKVNPVSGVEYIVWGIKPGGKRTFNASAIKGTIVERYSLADKVSSILYRHIKDDLTGNLDACFSAALKEAKKVEKGLKRTDDVIHCVIPNTITYSGGLGKKIHPTQKPNEILKYFITLLTNKDDMILDTFAGSGSTGVACDELERDCILIEQDKTMFTKLKSQFNPLLNNFKVI